MLKKILKKYTNSITGIIQVGAHIGQEVDLFLNYSKSNIYLFEPNTDAYQHLLKYVENKNVHTYNFALGNKNEKRNLYLSDNKNGVSSSVLKPKLHLEYFPEYKFSKKQEIDIKRFNDLDNIIGNFLILDVQGFELEVLKGFDEKIKDIDFIFSEISFVEFYEENVSISELDRFLANKNFIRAYTSIVSNIPMGDALYIKKTLNKKWINIFYLLKSNLVKTKIFRFLNIFKDLKKLSFHLKNKIKRTVIK